MPRLDERQPEAVPGPGAPAPRTRVAPGILAPNVRTRKHMVRWLGVFEGAWIGWLKRHSRADAASGPLEGAVDPVHVLDHATPGPDGSVWFDYVADLGDAFDPTMAVAWQIGRTGLTLAAPAPDDGRPTPPAPLPRGRLLVLGGDEVYPAAGAGRYARQLLAPYGAAFEGDDDHRHRVVAIPGNHDWMNGIGAFEDIFVRGNELGRWRAEQSTRWFVVRLPHGWWLWGIDTALGGQVGDTQADHFRRAAALLAPGDRVVLCTPVPLWQLRAKRPADHDALRALVASWMPDGVTVPLYLSGDSHYFAVHEGRDDAERPEWHVTTGGGGAFLHPTHSLAPAVPADGPAEYALRCRWPTASDSRAVMGGARLLTDRQTLTVLPAVALAHGLGVALAGSRWLAWGADRVGSFGHALGRAASSALFLAVLAAIVLVGRRTVEPNSIEQGLARIAKRLGWVHGLVLAALWWLTTGAVAWWVDTALDARGAGRAVAYAVGSLVSAALVYGWFLAALRWLCTRYRLNDNLAYAAAHSGRYKHFLRCRVDAAGDLAVFAVGIDPIGSGWARALQHGGMVPPDDPHGEPRLHYLWGRTFTPDATTPGP